MLGSRVPEKGPTIKGSKPKFMTEVARKQSDEVSVEDEAFGDTDENIVRAGGAATSKAALKQETSQGRIVNHRPTDSLRIKETQNVDIYDDEHD